MTNVDDSRQKYAQMRQSGHRIGGVLRDIYSIKNSQSVSYKTTAIAIAIAISYCILLIAISYCEIHITKVIEFRGTMVPRGE